MRYQTVGHDSIQYHAFCDGKVFAVRIFRTDTLEHHSAWIYDNGIREVVSSVAPILQSGAPYLDVSCPTLMISAPGDGCLSVRAGQAGDEFDIEFKCKASFEWRYDAVERQESVLHQPNLDCRIRYQGREFAGVGYHKRYYWKNPPRYWGYRFLHGVLEDDGTVIWTADAVFGVNKYDYFKILNGATGELLEADPNTCAHKAEAMFGVIGAERHEVKFTAEAVWEKRLLSSGMDSHMRQCAGAFTHNSAGVTRRGAALTEYCFGTLG
ncbi:MAG: hypothetical protein NW215_15245 [Hyphomicrobiales bacterium]|nr:hypothetical protein [Hyphomicrobiales bacterium]